MRTKLHFKTRGHISPMFSKLYVILPPHTLLRHATQKLFKRRKYKKTLVDLLNVSLSLPLTRHAGTNHMEDECLVSE